MEETTQQKRNRWQRERRKRNRNCDCKAYEKTINGFLMRKYRNMLSRINGVQKKKHHLYEGLYLLPRDDFYLWAKESPKFYELYYDWKDNGYPRRLAPSVDRIDSSKGYYPWNMEWVTHSENSRRGAKSLKRPCNWNK